MKLKKKNPESNQVPSRLAAPASNPLTPLRREFEEMLKRTCPDESDDENISLLWAVFLAGAASAASQIGHNAALVMARVANDEAKRIAEDGNDANVLAPISTKVGAPISV